MKQRFYWIFLGGGGGVGEVVCMLLFLLSTCMAIHEPRPAHVKIKLVIVQQALDRSAIGKREEELV